MDPAVLLTIGGMAGLAVTLTLAVWRAVKRPTSTDSFDEALARMTGSDSADNDTSLSKTNRLKGGFNWNAYWRTQFEKSGRRVNDPAAPGRTAAGVLIVATFFGIAVFPGGIYFPLATGVAYAGLTVWLSMEKNRRRAAIEKQLPLLLSGLRSQIQAGEMPQSALLSIADDLPEPLGDEMRQFRSDINVGIPLDTALASLASRSQSKIMQFLASSLGVAIPSGTDIVPQLVVIEETVRQRTRIQGKIRSALALARPTAYIAAVAPLAMGAWMIFTDPSFLAFYSTGSGLIMLAIAGLLYGAGLVTVRIMVSNVEKV